MKKVLGLMFAGFLSICIGTLFVIDQKVYAVNDPSATVVYGQPDFSSNQANQGVATSSATLNQPVAVLLDGSNNLYVADQSNNRVLYYPSGSTTPTRVYGQPDFTHGSPNQGGLSATTLNQPAGLFLDSGGNLYIADSNNNRVLYYPSGSTTATAVYGQADFTHNNANRGGSPSAVTLSGPKGVFVDGSGNVYIADKNNNRVLYYPSGSTTATAVYGQADFSHNSANQGGAVNASTLSGPRKVIVDSSNNVYISDNGNNRVLYYVSGSTTATAVYGQSGSFSTSAANGGGIGANTLNSPNGLFLDTNNDLYVSDGGNSRILHFAYGSTTPSSIYGQVDFTHNSANQGGSPSASTLDQASGFVMDSNGGAYVADQTNNRVLYYSAPVATPTPTPSVINATAVFGQNGSFTTNTVNTGGISANTLDSPYGIHANSDGSTYIADNSNNRVLFYSPFSLGAYAVYGQADFVIRSSATGTGGLSGPHDVTEDANQNVYIVDSSNNRVLFYPSYFPTESTAATLVYGQIDFNSNLANHGASISASTLSDPESLAVDTNGGAYISDSGNNRVLYYPQGTTSAALVYGQPNFATGSANTNGLSATSLNAPRGLSLDANNNLYISDSGNNRVLYYPQGTTSAALVYGQPDFTHNSSGVSTSKLNGAKSVVFDSSTNGIYVADTNNNRVVHFHVGSQNADKVYGQPDFVSKLANQGATPSASTLSGPRRVSVDGNGNLFIADTGNNRVLYYGSQTFSLPSPSVTPTPTSVSDSAFKGICQFTGEQDTENTTNTALACASLNFYWNQFPKNPDGSYDFSQIEQDIAPWSQAGKKVVIRITASGNCYPSQNILSCSRTPDWVYAEGVRSVTDPSNAKRPVYWDSTFLTEWGNFIKALAAKYDGDQRIIAFNVAIGSDGELRVANTQEDPNIAADWQNVGYTDQVWWNTLHTFMADYENNFHLTPLALQAGNPFLFNTYTESQLLNDFHSLYPSLWLQDDGMYVNRRPLPSVFSLVQHIEEPIGNLSSTGDTMLGELQEGLALGANYIYVFATDVNSTNQAALNQIAALVPPTPTPVPNTSSGSSSCLSGQQPGSPPQLYAAIAQGSSAITVYFIDAGQPYDHYSIEYGTHAGSYVYGATNIGSTGTRSYVITNLSPNTTYFFRVASVEGCVQNSWSNEISATTNVNVSSNSFNITSSQLTQETTNINTSESVCSEYTVKPGDGLMIISQHLLGDESRFQEIKDVNVKKYPSLSYSNNLEPGWVLSIKCSSNQQVNPLPFGIYELSVRVLDTKGKPVAGAKVTLHSVPQTAITDTNGIARFKNVEKGDHKVILAYNNYIGEENIHLDGNVKKFDLTVKVQPSNTYLPSLAIGIIVGLGVIIIILVSMLAIILKKRKMPVF